MHNTHILVRIMKEITGYFWSYIWLFVNICIDQSTFASIIKYANITLVFKKQKFERKLLPGSYVISKIFIKILPREMTRFMDQFLLKIQWCFLQVIQCSVFPSCCVKEIKDSRWHRKSGFMDLIFLN